MATKTKKAVTETTRLDVKRAQLQTERATIDALKKKIYAIVDLTGMDEEKMSRRVTSALKSEYGRVNGLVNLLAAVANWPAEQGDGSSVNENRMLLEQQLKLDLMLLDDIRTYRGYHTFVTDELEIIDGVEPQYEDYEDYVAILLTDMKLTPGKVAINPSTWARTEAKTKQNVQLEIERMQLAVERHKTLIAEYEK